MSRSLRDCRRVLFIRLDNMGDVIMSSPAFRAVKKSMNCQTTLLTSSAGAAIAIHLDGIDDIIEFNVPWVKGNPGGVGELTGLVQILKERSFDMAIIFTVFSQNPLPAAMLAYLAEIPVRLAYCRENPYQLITHWIPETEPHDEIRHQVERDMELVRHIGVDISDDNLHLTGYEIYANDVRLILRERGLDFDRPWILVHPGVSEEKRRYPVENWRAILQLFMKNGIQIVVTGGKGDVELVQQLLEGIGEHDVVVCGDLALHGFIALVNIAPFVVCVNTVTAHIAAATNTPVVVLYALTNPQHAPWKGKGKVFVYDIPAQLRSRNMILQQFYNEQASTGNDLPSPEEIAQAVLELYDAGENLPCIPKLVGVSQKKAVLNFQEP